jgi:hypothetical protein
MIFATSIPPTGGLKGSRTNLQIVSDTKGDKGRTYEGVKKIFIHRRANPAFIDKS